jgi:prepilin-type N-terminal cleavage/methylation domain-containing protein
MRADGFSLIELLAATMIVTVGVVSLARLFVVSADANRLAHTSSMAVLLAQQKVEGLRADTRPLVPSPPGALSADTPGYVDYLDAGGGLLTAPFTSPPRDTVYVRRWSIDPLTGSLRDAVALQVLVVPWSASGGRVPGSALLVTVSARSMN